MIFNDFHRKLEKHRITAVDSVQKKNHQKTRCFIRKVQESSKNPIFYYSLDSDMHCSVVFDSLGGRAPDALLTNHYYWSTV